MRPIDAEPIEKALFRQADKALAKNPYANARVCAFRRAFELISDAPTIEFPPNDAPPNDPLTLEQLREMDGEPVWIEREGKKGRWALIRFANQYCLGTHGCGTLAWEDYGKTWLAYRRKPEEG